MIEISTDIKYLKGVGEKRAKLLAKLGIFTVGDLLWFFPRGYDDRSHPTSIFDAVNGEIASIRAVVCNPVSEINVRKGMTLYKTTVSDGDSLMNLTFFNNKYIKDQLKEGEEYIFTGKVSARGYYIEMSSPAFEKAETGERICPVYSQTQGLNSKAIEKLVHTALECVNFSDPLPVSLREKYCLMTLEQALYNIHIPQGQDLLSEARRRLVFEELLMLRIGLMRLKNKNSKATSCIMPEDYSKQFISSLPFELTNAQKRAVSECISDMKRNVPMNRLLQGDVGSGKTAVAACVIYNAAMNGYQSALMAPTEVLAAQHYKTFEQFFEGTSVKAALLTGSTPASEKRAIKQALSCGDIDLIIGTHALIQKDVEFENLGIVITDEQHRFGVNQRTALGEKGASPHTLVMSATPIPRTLALIIYSDLDLSILDELPKGRQKIETYCIDSKKRERAYGYVKKHLCEGRQAYIVCPLVEEDEELELISATELCRSLADGFFKGFSVELLHGKMKADEKRAVMNRFSSGETDLLVSTTVIEVGIDVPNAVIMVVENAERFGLSQLHQLRGRIGRGEYKSTCILISDAQNADSVKRLDIMASTTDGFKIADEDLKLRGPGDFFGSRQHGLPDLHIADLMNDAAVLRETGIAAQDMLNCNPSLEGEEFAALRKRINEMFSRAMN